jgi:glycosyltransferase involved in cell wall biosynthesis
MVLKAARREAGEKGVLLAMYSETFIELPAIFDLPRLVRDYCLVLEPSTWGYQDPAFLLYHGADADVFVLAQHRQDFEYLATHGHHLVPVRLGAGDWVNPDAFQPRPGAGFEYDVAMVSAWDPVKRHSVLFDALAAIRSRRGRVLSVALVGYPMRWRRDHIERLLDRCGVSAQCTIYESVPPAQVADIVSRSRVSLLLSRREGANRAIYESLFCNTPVLVPRDHLGVNLEVVNAATGRLFSDSELPEALLSVIDGREAFRPREWALAHTGWEVSTAHLNAALKEAATRRGEPWTEDIAGRKSEPNLRYARAGAHREFETAYLALEEYLRPAE